MNELFMNFHDAYIWLENRSDDLGPDTFFKINNKICTLKNGRFAFSQEVGKLN